MSNLFTRPSLTFVGNVIMNQNPYQSPVAIGDPIKPSLGPVRQFSGKSWLMLSLILRLLFRLGGVAFVVLVMFIHTKGTPVNWTNVRPVFAMIGVGCLLTHLIPIEAKRSWITFAAGPGMYLAGLTLGWFVFATELYPDGV